MRRIIVALLGLLLAVTPAAAQYSSPSVIGLARPGQVPGTITNDDAAAGKVGEYVSATVLTGAAVSLPTATSVDITSISLTAGDWDVSGNVFLSDGGGTLVTVAFGWVSSTSATLPTAPATGGMAFSRYEGAGIGLSIGLPMVKQRFSLAATTTIYLSARATSTVATPGAFGFISARRVR